MAAEEHKSLKEVDRELAEKAEELEKAIAEAEARHAPGGGEARADDEASPAQRDPGRNP